MKKLAIIVTALLLCLARDGAAQGFINPFVGTTLTSPSPRGESSNLGYGVAFGGMGGIIGGETEIAYFPELLDTTANSVAKSRVVTFSGSVLIGPMIGPVKAYAAVGAGNLNLNVTSLASVVVPNPTSISSNYFTLNVGGGVMGFFSSHFGVRGDLRYYRAFGFSIEAIETAVLQLDEFDFWRANFGLAVKF